MFLGSGCGREPIVIKGNRSAQRFHKYNAENLAMFCMTSQSDDFSFARLEPHTKLLNGEKTLC